MRGWLAVCFLALACVAEPQGSAQNQGSAVAETQGVSGAAGAGLSASGVGSPSREAVGRGFGSGLGEGRDQVLGEVRLMLRDSQLGGDKDFSYLQGGVNDLVEINYYQDTRWGAGHRLQILMMARGTNDESIDVEPTSLQKGYARWYGERNELIFGDVMVNQSRMSLNQGVKGFSGAWRLGERWKLSTTEGVYADRWANFYKDSSYFAGRPYVSALLGSRLEYKPNSSTSWGANLAASRDLQRTLPPSPVGVSPDPIDNVMGSIDGRYGRRGLRLEGELAVSAVNPDRRVVGQGFDDDWAGRLEGSYKVGKWSLRGMWTRIQPSFFTAGARQVNDMQDWSMRLDYELSRQLSVSGTLRRTNNGLDGQLPYATTLWGPEGRAQLRNLPFYRKLTLDLGFRARLTSATTSAVDNSVRDPYVEATAPVGRVYFMVGVERRRTIDRATPANSSNSVRVYGAVRGSFTACGWRAAPNLRFEVERLALRPGLGATPVDDALFHDSNRIGSASLTIEAPRWFLFEGMWRNASATIHSAAGYRRPNYQAQLTYKWRNQERLSFSLQFLRANNIYLSRVGGYDERQIGVVVDYKFGRGAR